MTLQPDEKKSLSIIRMQKAREFYRDAVENHSGSRYRTAVNRAYYALMNAVRSVLILEGVNPLTHEGIVTMMSLHFVKKGLLPVQTVKNYKLLFSRRTDVDYGDFDSITEDESLDSINTARDSIELIDSLREEMTNFL